MHGLIPQVVNFGALVVVLFVFLRKPIKEMVAARRGAIKTQVDEARIQKEDAQKKYKEFSEKLARFESEARTVLEEAKRDGEALKAKIIADAKASADRMVKEADSLVQANVQEYKDHLRRETIAKAIELAEVIVKERLSSDDQRRIVNEYVGKV
jgi:F-type H+-transporting ATPase subunit b